MMRTPQTCESPVAAGLSTVQTKSDTHILPDPDPDRNAFDALKAQLAAHEYGLYDLACGGFLIARWDRTTHLSDLAAVRRFLTRATGGNHG